MPKINNIHDRFVRESFSDPERAAASLETLLPPEISSCLGLESLQVLKESYIDGELAEYFSDLVFEVPIKESKGRKADVVLLFEHKSRPDKHVLIQVGHYVFSHYMKTIRKKEPLKLIIPVIYYQGEKKWKTPNLGALFKDYPDEVRAYVPDLKHIFVALHSLSDETLIAMRHTLMASALLAQKWRSNPSMLVNEMDKIFSLFDTELDDRNFLETVVVYIFNASETEVTVVEQIMQYIPPKAKENIMTTYDKIIQKYRAEGEIKGIKEGEIKGKLEGKLEGIREGQIKGKIEVVITSYEKGLPIPLIANITNMEEEQVKKILSEHQKM